MKKSICFASVFWMVMVAGLFTAQAEETIVSQSIPQAASVDAASYWTREKMRKARPFTPGKKKETRAYPVEPGDKPPAGPPGHYPSKPPVGSSATPVDNQISDLERTGPQGLLGFLSAPAGSVGLAAVTGGYNYPPPQTTFKVLNLLYGTTSSVYPYTAVGKVFFTASDGNDYMCSGSSTGNRAVLTAGHCVAEDGAYHTNWVFIPSYKNESTPYGTWKAKKLYTFASWSKNGDFGRDIGFAVVSDKNGKTLSSVVGALGFSYNVSRLQHWNMLGYPARAPYDGEILYETQASFASMDSSETPNPNGIGTKQNQGCSGGPWIRGFVPNGKGNCNYANGVNSYAYDEEPNQIYSPYFDAEVNKLRNQALAQ